TRRWTIGIERALQVRRSGIVAADQFFDVHYHELNRDPITTVRRIYAHFGMTLSATAETRMLRFIAENPKDKHGQHRYSLETFGLEPGDLTCRFKGYREYLGIPSEWTPAG